MKKHDIIKHLPLYTERLVIRQPTAGDIDAIQRAKEERTIDLRQWMSWADEAGLSREGTESWIKSQPEENNSIGLIALDKGTDEFVLCTGLDGLDDEFSTISTGYWITKAYEGKGYVFEAMTTLLSFAFQTANTKRVEMAFYEGNLRSKRAMERLGLTFDRIDQKSHTSHLTGELMDVYRYSKDLK